MTHLYLDVAKPLYASKPSYTNRVATLLTIMFAKCPHCEGLFANEEERDSHIEYKCTEVTNE